MNDKVTNNVPATYARLIPTFAVGIILLLGATNDIHAATFFGPSPYTSTADIPAGFYAGGSPTGLEDFEDGSLDFGITAVPGALFGIFGPPTADVDSVDVDDGAIDGSGLLGHSYFSAQAPVVTFTFPAPVTAAGIVWTDGTPGTGLMTTFEAFEPGLVSLGTIGPLAIGDGVVNGTTAEDRFFGVTDLGGILAIKLSNTDFGLELDHVQFGNAVPEPTTLTLTALGLVGLALAPRRRK